MDSSPLQKARSRVGVKARLYGRDAPETQRARAQLNYLKALTEIAEREAREAAAAEAAETDPGDLVAADPPLDERRRDLLAPLLRPATPSRGKAG